MIRRHKCGCGCTRIKRTELRAPHAGRVFSRRQYYVELVRNYEVSVYGIFARSFGSANRPSLVVVSHWLDEVRAKVGTNYSGRRISPGRHRPTRAFQAQWARNSNPKLTGAMSTRPTARPSGSKLRPQTHASLVSKPWRHFHATSRGGSASPMASAMAVMTKTARGSRFMSGSLYHHAAQRRSGGVAPSLAPCAEVRAGESPHAGAARC